MRAVSFIVSALLAGSAFAQAPATVYLPASRDVRVPKFINATVVRVDTRRNTMTVRSESGDVTLTVEGSALAGLGRLHAGDDVILGYRADTRSGRPVQIVTAILAGRDMAGRGRVAVNSATAVPVPSRLSGRVVRTDVAAGTVTLVDAQGRTETLAVEPSLLGTLGSVLPGDQVEVGFVPGAPVAGTGVVATAGIFGVASTLQPVTPTFVTGRVVAFDTGTGAVRLQTPFGTSLFTLPSGRFDTGLVRVGQDVRLDLTGRATGMSVTGVSALGGGATAVNGPAVTTTTRSTSGTTTLTSTTPAVGTFATPLTMTSGGSVRTTGIAGTIGTTRTTGTVATVGGVVPGTTGGVATPTTSTLAPVGPARASGTTGLNATTPNGGTAPADVAAPGTIAAQGSPFAAVIPSLPSVVGQLNVVPPPAAASALMADALPVGAARDVATRDYDSAVRMLALKANEIDAHWQRYRDGCLRTSALTPDIDRRLFATNRDREWFVLFDGDVRTPADDNCRQLMVEMTRMANDWKDQMIRVGDTARKNDVLPGAMRESRQRYRVEF